MEFGHLNFKMMQLPEEPYMMFCVLDLASSVAFVDWMHRKRPGHPAVHEQPSAKEVSRSPDMPSFPPFCVASSTG